MTSFSISTQSINKDIVIIAWHLHEFCLIDHSLSKSLSQDLVQIVKTLIIINFRSIKFSSTRNIRTSTKSIDYSFEWSTTSFVFQIATSQFFREIEQYRQSTIFQSFDNHRSTNQSIENSTINNSTSKRQSFTFERQTFTDFFAFRRAERFYQADDTFVSKRNQFTIRIFRAFNYSFIIDSNVNNIVDQFDFNSQISNQFVNVNQFIDTNSTITRKTSIKKTIYSTLIESTMTRTIDFVVQTIIDVSMNIMLTKIKEMIASQTRQSKQVDFNDSIDSSDSSEFFDDNDNDNDTSRWQSIDLEFFDSYYENKFFVIVSSMTHFDKDVIFRDVHVFVNRVKELIIIKKAKLIRNNLSTCLRE